ncbi:MAG: hypothetical protein HOV87_17200 [Catenulispora sp.]|nr:hypothetical protein [Catenulispora sp.]
MTELLELEPRETATAQEEVDAAFSGEVDAVLDHTQCFRCGDDLSQSFFASGLPW